MNDPDKVDLVDIKEAIQTGKVRITDRAYEEAGADRLKFDEIYFSVLNGAVIEEYQDESGRFAFSQRSDIRSKLCWRPHPQCLGL